MDIMITSSMLRKAAEFHKTTSGASCIRAVQQHEKGTRFLTVDQFETVDEDTIVKTFDRCPVCGKVFDG